MILPHVIRREEGNWTYRGNQNKLYRTGSGRIQRSMAELLYNWDVHEVALSEDLVDIVLSFAPSSLPDYSI